MNFLDIILICIAGIFLVRGFFRGLVQEVMSLAAIIIAVYLASNYQHLIVPHLELYIDSEITIGALAYIVLFLGTIVLFWLLARLIKSVLDISLLGWVDRTAGGIFGFIEGALIGLILIMFLQSFAPKSNWVKESYIVPHTQHLVEFVGDFTPETMRDVFNSDTFHIPSAQEALDSAKDAIGLDEEQAPE